MTTVDTNINFLNINEIIPENIVICYKWIKLEDDKNQCDALLRRICLLTNDKTRYHKYCGFNKFTEETFPSFLNHTTKDLEYDWYDICCDNILLQTYNEIEQKRKEKEQKNDEQKNDEQKNDEQKNDEHTFEKYKTEELENIKIYIKKYVFDATAKIFTDDDCISLDRYIGWQCYKTLDNYDVGFVVLINNDSPHTVHVYGRTKDVVIGDIGNNDIKIFNNLIFECRATEIFVGESNINKMTIYSGGYGRKWSGNSLLLRIDTNQEEFKYICIGNSMYEFTTEEKITNYVSSVGNNCVPYPYAESLNWCYCMTNNGKTPISNHKNRIKRGYIFDKQNTTYEVLSGLKKNCRT